MKIVVIHTGLFPAAATLDVALARMQEAHPFVQLDLRRTDLRDEDWDSALAAILAADLVVSS